MARQRLNRLVNDIHDRQLEAFAREYLRGRVLDVGCGTKPYGPMLAGLVDAHLGLDHPESPHDLGAADLVARAYDVPIRDGAVDGVLCTAVLEHLEEPATALAEWNRVLRLGGVAVISTPFIWHLHEEPRDFFRYSMHGLRYLLEKSGFDVVCIRALAGFWVTVGQLFNYYLARFDRGLIRRLRLLTPVYVVVQAVAGALDRVDRAEQWTWAYMAVARKK